MASEMEFLFPIIEFFREERVPFAAAWFAQGYMSGPSPEHIAGDLLPERWVKTGPTPGSDEALPPLGTKTSLVKMQEWNIFLFGEGHMT